MASLGELLQRVARSLEEAGERGPADDLRARLGYGVEDEDDDEPAEDAFLEPETGAARAPPAERAPETEVTRTKRPIDREPGTVWTPLAARTPAQPATEPRAPGSIRAPAPGPAPGYRRSSPAAPPHRPLAPPESPLPERVRARLRTPDALREAFVVKEVLDRPLARRRRGPGMR